MRKLKWLYPGMMVKRWIFVTIIGILLISMGFVVVISEQVVFNKTFAGIIIIIGMATVVLGVKRILKNFINVLLPGEEARLVDKIYAKRILDKGPRVVAIGGGHGLSTLLHGLKEYTSNITAVVTVADDGGSSGRLREEFNVLPPGDIRNCLVALADEEDLVGRLFQFRFNEGKDLKGHNFGNLFITAMSTLTGDFQKAIKESSKVLAIRGNVIPATISKPVLIAEHADGSVTEGESKIPYAKSPIVRLKIKPDDCEPTKEAIDEIKRADVIIMGPGSLYTSIMPNLLIKGLTEEVLQSKAKKIYVCNVMTQHGETDEYKVSDHVKAIIEHTSKGIVKYIIVNTGRLPEKLLNKYEGEMAFPVALDDGNVRRLGCEIIKANIINTEDYIRHNPHRLARIIMDLISNII